ncbi:MAG: response regulator transcription factor [Pseudomonadota bacterium]
MKVLLIDDHWVSRAGLRHLIESFFPGDEIGEVDNFEDAITAVRSNGTLSLIVTDLLIPGHKWVEGLAQLRQESPTAPIMIFSMIEDRSTALKAIELGATAYVPKSTAPQTVTAALPRILDGDIYLPPNLMAMVRSDDQQDQHSAGRGSMSVHGRDWSEVNLTRRQREVLFYLAGGHSNGDIAKMLEMSENTVRIHVSAILKALDVDNRTKAAIWANQNISLINVHM